MGGKLPVRGGKQLDLPHFAVDTAFVQVLSGSVRAGFIREVTPSGLAVWLCIRTFARHKDGRAYCELKQITDLTGLSPPTCRKAIQRLVETNYLRVCEDGRKKRYYLFDRLPYTALRAGEDTSDGFDRLETGDKDGFVEVKWVPALAGAARADIASWSEGGERPSQVNGVQLVGLQAVKEQTIEVARVKKLVVESVELPDGTQLDFDPTSTFGKRVVRVMGKKRDEGSSDD